MSLFYKEDFKISDTTQFTCNGLLRNPEDRFVRKNFACFSGHKCLEIFVEAVSTVIARAFTRYLQKELSS